MTAEQLTEYDRLISRGINRQPLTDAQKRRVDELGKIKIEALRTGEIERIPKPGYNKTKKKKRRVPKKPQVSVSESYAAMDKERKIKRREQFLKDLGLQP